MRILPKSVRIYVGLMYTLLKDQGTVDKANVNFRFQPKLTLLG